LSGDRAIAIARSIVGIAIVAALGSFFGSVPGIPRISPGLLRGTLAIARAIATIVSTAIAVQLHVLVIEVFGIFSFDELVVFYFREVVVVFRVDRVGVHGNSAPERLYTSK
jgi:hypothetical protein